MPAASVARIAFGMGIKPTAKADNIRAILAKQEAPHEKQNPQRQGGGTGEQNAPAAGSPVVQKLTPPAENNLPATEVNKPKAQAAGPAKPATASDMLLSHGKSDGLFPNDFEKESDTRAVVNPDALEGMTESQRRQMRGRVSADDTSGRTGGMTYDQARSHEAATIERFGSTKAEQIAQAIEHYKNSPDANLRKLVAYADAEGTGPKVSKPVESFNHGDTFELGNRKFTVEVDEHGNTHFIDTDIEIPYADGDMKYNAGSLKKAPTMEDTPFVPPEAAKEPWQMTRAEYAQKNKLIDQAAIRADGRIFTGQHHGEAINKALKEGALIRDDNGRLIDAGSGEHAGYSGGYANDNMDLFTLHGGGVINRLGADAQFNVQAAENMGNQFANHRAAVEKAISEGKPVPREVLADYPDLAKSAKTTGPQGSLLGERYEGSGIGSKTPGMFGDVSNGPKNELEARVQREAAEAAKKPTDPTQGKLALDNPAPGEERVYDRRTGDGAGRTKPTPGTETKTTPRQTPQETANGLMRSFDWLRRVFAPQTAGPLARDTGNRLRTSLGEMARHEEQTVEHLKAAKWYFDGQTKEANQVFIDRYQAGEKQPTPELQRFADVWDKISRQQTDRLDALDPEIRRQWEEHHIKQLWKETSSDPGKVEQVVAQLISKRPLEGSKGFLKKKIYLTYAEGRAAGLTPLYDNPVDAMMHGYHEAEQYIQMHQFANQIIHSGLSKYIAVGEKVPEGYATIDDPAFTRYAPPTISVNEYVNKSVHDALQQVADRLGIRVKTVQSGDGLSRGALGTAYGGSQAVRKFGTDIGVLAHEIGHNLDARYDLQKHFLQPKYAEEMRAVADMYGYKKAYFRKGEEKMAAMMDAWVSAPDTFRNVAPTVYREFETFLSNHDALLPLAELERGLGVQKLTTEIPRGGITKMGSYAVPKEMADVIGNHLSRGINNPVFRGYRVANNLMNSVQLAGAFHAGFTSMDSAISRGALGIEQLANGRPVQAIKSMLSAPAAPITNAWHGHQLIDEYLRPGTHPELSPVVDALVQGGARIHQNSALQNKVTANMVRAFRQGDFLGGAARIPGAAMDAISWPIMEKLVPMQKWGVMGDLMREEITRMGPSATPEQVRDAARKVVDATDNRMGQVVYDNLFMNRKAKDLLMSGMRSVGWNLGTAKEVGGGIVQAPQNAVNIARGKGFATHNTPYVMAMLGLTAASGALYQYLKTGQYPQTLQDYFQPKTGRKDDNGDDIRVQLPTYMRDVMAATHGGASAVPGNLLDMAASKLAPLPAALTELAKNKDYFGVQIADPDSSLADKTLARGKFLAKQAQPFGIQSMQRLGDAPMDEKIGSMLGLTPTPKRFIQTPAEQIAAELSQRKNEGLTRTQDQADQGQYKNALARTMKADPAQGRKAVTSALAAGKITDKEAGEIAKHADQSPLEWHMRNFTPPEALKVWDAASPEERAKIQDVVARKVTNGKASADEQDKTMREHGVPEPADLALTREHAALNRKEQADQDKQKELDSLRRQILAHEQKQEWAPASELRKQWQRVHDQANELTPRDKARLKVLREYVKTSNDVQKRVDEGSMTADRGATVMKSLHAKTVNYRR